jgi:hypothetical protein
MEARWASTRGGDKGVLQMHTVSRHRVHLRCFETDAKKTLAS